jgi:hypothetical protein
MPQKTNTKFMELQSQTKKIQSKIILDITSNFHTTGNGCILHHDLSEINFFQMNLTLSQSLSCQTFLTICYAPNQNNTLKINK